MGLLRVDRQWGIGNKGRCSFSCWCEGLDVYKIVDWISLLKGKEHRRGTVCTDYTDFLFR